MVHPLYFITAFVCALVLLIFKNQPKATFDTKDKSNRAYLLLSTASVIFCIHDGFWGILAGGGFSNDTLLFVSSTIFHTFSAIMAFLWLCFVLDFLGIHSKKRHFLQFIAATFTLVQFVLLIVNIFSHNLFFVNDFGEYQCTPLRESIFYCQYTIYVAIALLSGIHIFRKKNKEERFLHTAVLLFVFAPIICGIFQMQFPTAPYNSIGYMLGCCIIYEFVISRINSERKLSLRTAIIASLAADYDIVCYINSFSNSAIFFHVSDELRPYYKRIDTTLPSLEKLRLFLKSITHPDDYDHLANDIRKDIALQHLAENPSYTVHFRAQIEGQVFFYQIKMVTDKNNKQSIVLGVRNIDFETRRDLENIQLKKDLQTTTLIANRDALTGVGSVTAFRKMMDELDSEIEKGVAPHFAIIECDLNDLKRKNDTFGHDAGNLYIKNSCKVFCNTFKHSPVFRIGGDEFVILLQDEDLLNKDELFKALRIAGTQDSSTSFASGIAEYDSGADRNSGDVLKRADTLMYANKKFIKSKNKGLEND